MGTQMCLCSHDFARHEKSGIPSTGPVIANNIQISDRYTCKVPYCECVRYFPFNEWHPFTEGDEVTIKRGKYVGHSATVIGWSLKHWYTPVEPTLNHLLCVVKLDKIDLIKRYDKKSLRQTRIMSPNIAIENLKEIMKGLQI